MHRVTILAATLAAIATVAALPAAAEARKTLCATAYPVRVAVVKKHGADAAGRNICRWDVVRKKGGTRPPTNHEKAQYLRVLRRLNAPPPRPGPPLLTTRAMPPRQRPAGTMSARPTANLPSCADESAGNYSTGPANTNPSSGATGRWQTLRSHYSSGGICQGLDLSPGGQDTCAARIYAAQGAGAWTNCG